MRIFTMGAPPRRHRVMIELSGARMRVTQEKPDGTSKRTEKELSSATVARGECERLARELLSRGYTEQSGATQASADVHASNLLDEDSEPAGDAGAVLSRRGAVPGATPAAKDAPAKKKKSRGKKKRKKAETGDALDKRVFAAVGFVGLLVLAAVGFFVYDAFVKPPTIVGTWRGSMIDFEIGRPIIRTEYELLLDEKKRASMTLQEKYTSIGTYAVKGNRLILTFKDDDGEAEERQYKFKLRRATLELFDPNTDKLLVELLRFREPPKIDTTKRPKPADE